MPRKNRSSGSKMLRRLFLLRRPYPARPQEAIRWVRGAAVHEVDASFIGIVVATVLSSASASVSPLRRGTPVSGKAELFH